MAKKNELKAEKKQELKNVFKPYEVASFTGEYTNNFIIMLDVLHNAINETVVKSFYSERKIPGNSGYQLSREDIPTTYEVNVKDIALTVKGKHKNNMEKINYIYDKCVEEIKNKQNWIEVPVSDDSKERKTFVVMSALTSTQNGIAITISPEYRSLLTEWINRSKNFILYPLKDTMNMKSKYSKKLYPMLKRWVEGKSYEFTDEGSLNGQDFTFVIGLDEFVEILDIPKSYRLSHIKAVCDEIIEDINENTEYIVSVQYNYSSNGVGRPSVTHVAWNMILKADETLEDKLKKILSAHGKERDLSVIVQTGKNYGCTDDEIVDACTKTVESLNMIGDLVEIFLRLKETRGIQSLSEKLISMMNLKPGDQNVQLIIDLARSSSFDFSDDEIIYCCKNIKLPCDNLITAAVAEYSKYKMEKPDDVSVVDDPGEIKTDIGFYGNDTLNTIVSLTGESPESIRRVLSEASSHGYTDGAIIDLARAAANLTGIENMGGFLTASVRRGIFARDLEKSAGSKKKKNDGQIHFSGERQYDDEFFDTLLNNGMK